MHAHVHRWTTLVLVVATAAAIGCRGSRPFSRLVEVSRETDAGLPEIEAPRQRLATTKPREDSSSLSMTQERTSQQRASASPHVTQLASNITEGEASEQPPAVGKKTESAVDWQRIATRSTPRKAAQSASKTRSSAKPSTSEVAATPRRSSSDKTTSLAAKAATQESTDQQSMDPAKLMAAFSDYPPEVQEEALRQLVAATSRAADRTTQPNSLDAELAKNVLNLPELPEPTNETPEVPPKRIASSPTSSEPAIASIDDSMTTEAGTTEDAVRSTVTDLATTEIDSTVVQTISDTVEGDKSEVKRASASREANDPSMVATASVEPSVSAKSKSSHETEVGQLSDQALFESLLKRLATAVPGESEADRVSRLIRLRHLMVLSGNPDAAVKQVEGMSDSEQEYLRHQLLGLWTMIDPDGHPVPSRRFTAALPQLREATKFAAAATDSLDVRSLAFCTEIESYGQIKTFSGNRFTAGQQVILYCEIENFTVKTTGDGFETHLQGSYDVYNSDNEKVLSQLLPADQQTSSNYLRDYFIAYQMHLPQQLTAGTYRLQLTMEDVNGKKYGQASIPLEIAE